MNQSRRSGTKARSWIRAFAKRGLRSAEGSTGRPAFIDDGRAVVSFIDALLALATVEDAAMAAGVNPSTVYRSLRRGRKAYAARNSGAALSPEDAMFCEFCEVTQLAMVEAKTALVTAVFTASTKDWRCALKGP